MHKLNKFTTLVLLIVLSAGTASAQSVLAAWSFNAEANPTAPTVDNSWGAQSVTGAFIGLGGGFGPATGKQIGSSGDTYSQPDIGGILNNNAAGRSGPTADGLEASGTRILGAMVSTLDASGGLTVSWHAAQGYRASRYYQFSVTSDGVTYAPPTGGTGSTVGVAGQSTTATVDGNGLVTFIVNDGTILPSDNFPADSYSYAFSYTFPAGSAYENNPNFGFQLAAIYDPSGTDYVSSFAGTTGTADAVSGYIRSTSAGGNSIYYDVLQVEVGVVPEPGTIALSMGLVALGLVMYRRRK